MKIADVESFEELHGAIFSLKKFAAHPDAWTWVFRGQSSAKHLLPEIGRDGIKDKVVEDNTFYEWIKKSRMYLDNYSSLTDLELMCIARHHSIPTRLLDWTYSPLVAAYFAIKKEEATDAIIYCFNIHDKKDRLADKTLKPFTMVKDVMFFDPGTLIPRNVSQCGLFTIHKDPTVPLENLPIAKNDLHTIIIKQKYREALLRELSIYNIHEGTLFPDLDGLGRRMRWLLLER